LDCDLQLKDKFGKIYQNALAVLNKFLLVEEGHLGLRDMKAFLVF
jgi:hypothetical protein